MVGAEFWAGFCLDKGFRDIMLCMEHILSKIYPNIFEPPIFPNSCVIILAMQFSGTIECNVETP